MEFLRSKKSSLSLDMAPLIDIVFQLLIFFMLTSVFSQPAIKLNLPKAVQKDAKQQEKIVISVDKNGAVFINSEKTSMESLKSNLRQRLASLTQKSIHIRGDEEMPYRLFVEVMDTARQAGAEQINIVHNQAK